MSDHRGRLVAVESLLLIMLRNMQTQVPEETNEFIRGICSKTRAAIGRRGNLIAFPGLRHAVSDDALNYLVSLLERELPASGAPQGPDAA
jgi:hypothetical protein